ncbi:MAG: M3 family metallopeptidase [Muribaculaceae bacterium]|nr:M3 family metallopeptidase [Muribaculaceae bacterium]
MTKKLLTIATVTVTAASLTLNTGCMKKETENPFLSDYATEYQIPPFEQIKAEHYMPAFEEGIKQHNAEIEAIISNPEAPTFDNTILALDQSGELLGKVSYVFFALTESDNDDDLTAISEKAYPLLSEHSDMILMNDSLFQRVKALYDNRESLGLNTAQMRLLEQNYKNFVRAGALLPPAEKDELMKINQELSATYLKFSQNILAETNAWEMVVDDEAKLAGLPASSVAVAAEEAANRGMEGKWVFTLHAPSRLPLLTYADNRDLRETMYKGYTSLASNDNEYNNSANINKILKLRSKKAKMLGFDSFAAYQTDNVMAKTVDAAESLLMKIWAPAVKKANEEIRDMQAYADAHNMNITVEPWDYYYLAEKVKKDKFNFSEDEVRPYFQVDSVKKGAFLVANKLYGITLTEMPDAPKYNDEVTVYNVTDENGEHVAVFMSDYFPRGGKRQGAWMSEFKGSSNVNGVVERPIIYNVGNFTKPTKEMPSLLTLDEVETLFHEFGHGLHGMLTRATYAGQACTNVDRDFVELPSQINEHWAMDPQVLKMYAHHYQTGEVIPDYLIEKMEAAGKFNQGFITTELAAAALLDLEWHKLNPTEDIDVKEFEQTVAAKLGKPREIEYRYRSPYFKHIFGSDGYSAGYYTYLWAQVLDCDGYELFEQKGIFDPETAKSFKENVLEMGGSDDPMTLYVKFRGQEPNPDALLRFRGLK